MSYTINMHPTTSSVTRDLEMLASIRNELDDSDSILQALQNMNETNTCK